MSKFKLGYSSLNEGEGVLILYSGGTIGSMPEDRDNPDSPQVVVSWEEFLNNTPLLKRDNIGFQVDAYSTQPLDSCNLGPKEWKEMADVIIESYDKYEGFVILHGTDTMVYTASVLSFMLQNLGKPVVVTGAQMTHLFQIRNDGWQNLVTSLQIANPKHTEIPTVPEVCIYFGNKLMRGNRTRKINATGFDAYETKNFPVLANVGDFFEIDESLLLHPDTSLPLDANTTLSTDVEIIFFYPGIQNNDSLETLLQRKGLRGVILLAYGAGNIPTDDHIINAIKKARKSGIVFLCVTQTGGGRVELGMYDTSAILLDAGVISGVDISPEAAMVKMMHLLGNEDYNLEKVESELQRSIAGEQSLSIINTQYSHDESEILSNTNNRIRIAGTEIDGVNHLKDDSFESVLLRFSESELTNPDENGYIRLMLYAGLSSSDSLDINSHKYLGSFKKLPTNRLKSTVFNITKYAKNALTGRSPSITVVLDGATGSFTWKSVTLSVFAKS